MPINDIWAQQSETFRRNQLAEKTRINNRTRAAQNLADLLYKEALGRRAQVEADVAEKTKQAQIQDYYNKLSAAKEKARREAIKFQQERKKRALENEEAAFEAEQRNLPVDQTREYQTEKMMEDLSRPGATFRTLGNRLLVLDDQGNLINEYARPKEKTGYVSTATDNEREVIDRVLTEDEDLSELRGEGIFNLQGNYNAYADAVSSKAKEIMENEQIGIYDATRRANRIMKTGISEGEFNPDRVGAVTATQIPEGAPTIKNPNTGERMALIDGRWVPIIE